MVVFPTFLDPFNLVPSHLPSLFSFKQPANTWTVTQSRLNPVAEVSTSLHLPGSRSVLQLTSTVLVTVSLRYRCKKSNTLTMSWERESRTMTILLGHRLFLCFHSGEGYSKVGSSLLHLIFTVHTTYHDSPLLLRGFHPIP